MTLLRLAETHKMRHINRPDLDDTTAAELQTLQDAVNIKRSAPAFDVEKEWQTGRKTQALENVHRVLVEMTRDTERCMYCSHSEGADIEHFRPKSKYADYMFRWSNYLLSCPVCNSRYKGIKFPTDDSGDPLLIDPTIDEPWDHLVIDVDTGILMPKYIGCELKSPSPKGKATIDTLGLARRQYVNQCYQKTFKRLSKDVQDFLNGDRQQAQSLINHLIEEDECGLLGWCFKGSGGYQEPFSTLRTNYPDVWNALRAAAGIP
jgi:uncharacterized protein (TIGR02646 family)